MLLAIETAHPALSVALIARDRILAHHHEIIGRGHAERLVPAIADVMARAGCSRADAILVDVGPGSFTGARVGIACARALGLAWGVPVHGCSADALVAAAACAAGAERVLVVLDALRGELFVREYRADIALGEVEIVSPAAAATWAARVGAAAGNGVRLMPARPPWTHDAGPDARSAVLLASVARALPPVAHYGRAPDAVAR